MPSSEKNPSINTATELPSPPPIRSKKQSLLNTFSLKLNDLQNQDVAASFLSTLSPSIASQEISRKEEKKLLRKIDWILIPLISVSCILAAVDKVIISNAAIYGMEEDTHLRGNDYSWVGSVSRDTLALWC